MSDQGGDRSGKAPLAESEGAYSSEGEESTSDTSGTGIPGDLRPIRAMDTESDTQRADHKDAAPASGHGVDKVCSCVSIVFVFMLVVE